MVFLAQSSPGCRSTRSLQKKTTVMLGQHFSSLRQLRVHFGALGVQQALIDGLDHLVQRVGVAEAGAR